MINIRHPAIAALLVAFATGAQAATLSLDATNGSGWKSYVPASSTPNNTYPSPSPISGVGLVWEGANTGWNSSASYNDAGWAAYAGGWAGLAGATPFYAREVFNIAGTVTSASFTIGVDDDSMVWVNGTIVPALNDQSMGNNGTHTGNIASYLHSGNNVIAFKAHNSAGGGYAVYGLTGYVNYDAAPTPEPGMGLLLGIAAAGLLASRRRQQKRVAAA